MAREKFTKLEKMLLTIALGSFIVLGVGKIIKSEKVCVIGAASTVGAGAAGGIYVYIKQREEENYQ